MRSIRALLQDRRRAQRGSVLSAVLIIVAYIAIVSGALMTELSTNFLLSNNLVNRVAIQATVNSAMELALSRLQDTQTTPLYAGCPSLSGTAALNNMTAVATYGSCAPVIDSRSLQSFTRVVSSSRAFGVNGNHAVLASAGVDTYLTGNESGILYSIPIGQSFPAWSYALGGTITGTPIAVLDPSSSQDVSYLAPVTNPSGGNVSPSCGAASACVAMLSGYYAARPSLECFMPAGAPVISAPAAGIVFPSFAFFGDSAGMLFAYQVGSGSQCSQQDNSPIPGASSVVAGPFVFASSSKVPTDEIYVVVKTGGTGALVHYTFESSTKTGPALTWVGSYPLTGVPVGATLERNFVPARMAITFTNGQVDIAQIQSSFGVTVSAAGLPGAIADAPYWCHCPTGDLIGVGGLNGGLYLLDANLNLVASYSGASAISTSPAADAGGDWFFADAAGTISEVQTVTGQYSMVPAFRYGSAGAITSAPIVNSCAAGICIYFGSSDGNAYLVPLDARDAVVMTCISASPPSCSGVNPRLWVQVEVGVANNPRKVHVDGWSYYSP